MGSAPLRHCATALCGLLLFELMMQSSCAQQANRSGILPFRQQISPTAPSEMSRQDRAEKHNQNIGAEGNATGQRPWESQDGPLGAKTMEDTEIIARIGPEVILAGEILGNVNRLMEENRSQIPTQKWDEIRRTIMHKMLMPMIDQKLIVVDALQVIPEDALPGIEEQVDKQFYGEQINDIMERAEVESLQALEEKLKESGSSIAMQKQIFFERSMAAQWIQQQVTDDRPITHLEMFDYYTAHLEDYDQAARCCWEQLSVRFEKFASRQAAFTAICQMGNAVADQGAVFADVARAESQGLTASAGGKRDWTSRGSLVSAPLDQAIFSLPVGQLSPIIEDKTGYHIVRVNERVAAHRTPFRDAQVEIAAAIVAKRREAKLKEYLDSLRERIPVSTIFDNDPHAESTQENSANLATATQATSAK